MMFLCMFALSSYIPFMDNVNRLFIERFCFTQIGSGQAVMLTYLTCVVVSPFIGMLVDKIGKRRYFIVFTLLVYFTAHFFLLVYPSCLEGSIEMASITGLILLGTPPLTQVSATRSTPTASSPSSPSSSNRRSSAPPSVSWP